MSRSRRHTSIADPCGSETDKPWKRWWHRQLRARTRMALHDFDADTLLLPVPNDVCSLWDCAKEHKGYFDPREHPTLMRK